MAGIEHPKPPFPHQHQERQPGLEKDMNPQPQSHDPQYQGAGKLKGKVALITGGDSGIGRAVAVAFAKEGADSAVVYFDEHEDAAETKHLVNWVTDVTYCPQPVLINGFKVSTARLTANYA